jgi:hypothetical protein
VADVGGVCRVCDGGGGVAVVNGGEEGGAGKGEDRARGAAPGRGDRRRRSTSAWSCAHSSCFSLYCCFCRRTSASREVLLSSSPEILSLEVLVASEYASELRRIARSRAAESRRAANFPFGLYRASVNSQSWISLWRSETSSKEHLVEAAFATLSSRRRASSRMRAS